MAHPSPPHSKVGNRMARKKHGSGLATAGIQTTGVDQREEQMYFGGERRAPATSGRQLPAVFQTQKMVLEVDHSRWWWASPPCCQQKREAA